jgi:hypothetical protein
MNEEEGEEEEEEEEEGPFQCFVLHAVPGKGMRDGETRLVCAKRAMGRLIGDGAWGRHSGWQLRRGAAVL